MCSVKRNSNTAVAAHKHLEHQKIDVAGFIVVLKATEYAKFTPLSLPSEQQRVLSLTENI